MAMCRNYPSTVYVLEKEVIIFFFLQCHKQYLPKAYITEINRNVEGGAQYFISAM